MRSIIVFFVLMSIVASGQAGGYGNFLCPALNGTARFPCAIDCQKQHGADGGICGDNSGGDHNCYCDGRSGRVPQRSNLQCKEMNDNWRNLCTFDCLCNHGADGGHCMWDLGVCYCENWGRNKNNVGCPAKSEEEFISISQEITAEKIRTSTKEGLAFV
ncbi:unnamed protein product [Orchesella dallaii]|uniref:Uncharacterized protein n=1 Tax=Orchesella dallaii TaxID=48710 RepID=A0ABP1S5Q9_9HEXA